MARKRGKYRRVERRYVVDYVLNKFPNRLKVYFNLRLGPPPEHVKRAFPGLPRGYYKVYQRYADAVVITDTHIILIEAKVHNIKVGIGYLLEYKTLVCQTPELRPYCNRELRLLLVIPIPDPWVLNNARSLGIDVDIYCPDWLKSILREKHLL